MPLEVPEGAEPPCQLIVCAEPLICTALTINWQGGSAPTGTANGLDAFSFTILRNGSSYIVLGQMVDFA